MWTYPSWQCLSGIHGLSMHTWLGHNGLNFKLSITWTVSHYHVWKILFPIPFMVMYPWLATVVWDLAIYNVNYSNPLKCRGLNNWTVLNGSLNMHVKFDPFPWLTKIMILAIKNLNITILLLASESVTQNPTHLKSTCLQLALCLLTTPITLSCNY